MSNYQIVKYNLGKKNYEIVVKPSTVPLYRKQKITNLSDVLESYDVFRDFSKGELASSADLSEFELKSNNDILHKILMDGDYQLSTQERRELTEKKKREIITYIHKFYIEPKSGKPHPPERIQSVLEKVHYNYDYKQSAESQVKELIPKMLGQIALRKSIMECDLSLSHTYYGKCSGIIAKYCKVLSTNYTSDGVNLHMEIIPGDFDVFLKLLNDQTKGDYTFQVSGASASTDESQEQDGKGKKSKRGGKGGKGRK